MGTTGHAAAVYILDELAASAVRFAVLHRESEFAASGVDSDIDTIVDRDPDDVLRTLIPGLAGHGLRPIMRWPYDRNSVTFFLCDDSGAEGAQLDLVYDPEGVGRYGFRTAVLLDGAVAGERWPRLGDLDEQLYLLRKRQVKRDAGTVRQLVGDLGADDVGTLRERAAGAFSPRAAEALDAMLVSGDYRDPGSAAFDRKLWNMTANAPHYARRLRTRVGSWLSAPDADLDTVEEALVPFRGLLPMVDAISGRRSPLQLPLDRRRPRLIVSAGDVGGGRPDGVIPGRLSATELRGEIVTVLADRLEARR